MVVLGSAFERGLFQSFMIGFVFFFFFFYFFNIKYWVCFWGRNRGFLISFLILIERNKSDLKINKIYIYIYIDV